MVFLRTSEKNGEQAERWCDIIKQVLNVGKNMWMSVNTCQRLAGELCVPP